jgi:hypothetical protein
MRILWILEVSLEAFMGSVEGDSWGVESTVDSKVDGLRFRGRATLAVDREDKEAVSGREGVESRKVNSIPEGSEIMTP